MKIKDDSFFKSVRDYLTVYLPKQRRLSENTTKSYKTALNQFVDFLTQERGVPIIKITFEHFTPSNVNGYLDWLQEKRNTSSSTRNQRLMALRSFANYCAIADISNVQLMIDIENVPIQEVPGKVVAYFTEDALTTMLSLPNMKNRWGIRNGFFMILMYDTAARCQEMIDLQVGDFVLGPGAPYVYLNGKGEKSRTVPITDKTAEHLQRYLNFFHPAGTRCNEDSLFYTVLHKQRHPMSHDTIAYFISKYGREARKINPNVPSRVHPHQFRHTRAIHLYRSGVPLSLLSEILGHVNTSTTKIYAYADTEMKSKAIQQANPSSIDAEQEAAIWENDDDMVRRLYCMK